MKNSITSMMPFISIHFSTGVCAAQVTAPTCQR